MLRGSSSLSFTRKQALKLSIISFIDTTTEITTLAVMCSIAYYIKAYFLNYLISASTIESVNIVFCDLLVTL